MSAGAGASEEAPAEMLPADGTSAGDAPLLEARDLGRSDRAGNWLIRHINLSIRPGERWLVSGPSGSGKTLLLRSLCLLDIPAEGKILWHGSSVAPRDVPAFRTQVMYLQQRAVAVAGTVEENLQQPFAYRHCPASLVYKREAVLAALAEIGWSASFLDRDTGHLSGGERQVLALLRAIQLEPQILLLDEPGTGLDEPTALAVEKLVSNWYSASDRRATVWVTHDSRVAQRVASQVYRMPPSQESSG